MTLLDLIQRTTAFLEKRGVPSARFDTEQIVARALGLTRMQLYLQFERTLGEAELDALRPLVVRRGNREPLQHVLGDTSFCGLTLACDARALVPRPETEVLVNALIERAPDAEGLMADVGTGSGAIALAFLAARPGWRAIATDISPTALELARENAERTGLANRIEFRQGPLCEPLPDALDLIAANLPYLPDSAKDALAAEVSFDPDSALFGGADGLDFIRAFVPAAKERLRPGGWMGLEFGDGSAPHVEELLGPSVQLVADLTGRPRHALWCHPALSV